ncbi:MAG: copper homeostasis protein CutC [Armatimonadetes bacterium]|nr:copper homeostasis protein CutC [Armatimonadota bacterium]
MAVVLEASCGTVEEARLALAHGIDRVEICAALSTQGVTPSPGAFLSVRESTDGPVFAMILGAENGFTPCEDEFQAMLRDARWFAQNGADGLVFGLLNDDFSVDLDRNARLIEASQGLPCTFHRAFDLTPDALVALAQIGDLGFARLLTSGHAPDVSKGIEGLAMLRANLPEGLALLPGGGVRAENAVSVLKASGASELHFSLRAAKPATKPGAAAEWTLHPERVAAVRNALAVG